MIDTIQAAAELLRASQRPVVLSGAGVSRESGVPTFRDAHEGLWAQYDPQELATPAAFERHPKLIWDWYEYRRGLVNSASPNPGHIALAQMERLFSGLPIITQNVDTLHEQAGSTHVIHLHGNIHANKCFYDCQGDPTPVDVTTLEYDPDDGPPCCPYCGRKSVRPAVVWFGEMIPHLALQEALDLSQTCDVMLVIGTSGQVTPAATLPRVARQNGSARIIEVNPTDSLLTPLVDIQLSGASGELLPRLVAALKEG